MTHFQLFGLVPSAELDVRALEAKHRELSLALHPDRLGPNADSATRRAAVEKTTALNDALKVLKDPYRRMTYLLELQGLSLEKQQMPMEFLEEVMERRDQLAQAKQTRDLAAVRQMGEHAAAALASLLKEAAAAIGAHALQPAAMALAKARYFVRFAEEVDAIEEEAL